MMAATYGVEPSTLLAISYAGPDSSNKVQQSKATAHPSADSQAILKLARAALEAGNTEMAVSILARLPEKDGESHFAAGALLVKHKAYAPAAKEFGLARLTYKDAYLAGYDETLAYVNAEDYAAAIKTANELLTQGFQTSELAAVAGTAYQKSGQTQEAYNAFRLATHLNPRNEDAYVDLCDIALEKDSYDLGVEIAGVGLANLPNSERLYVQRGVMRAMKGQFEDAQKDFTKASELAPNEVLPDVAIGLLAMQTSDLEKSVQDLHRAAERHPDSYLAQYWFGKALERSGAAPGTKEGDDLLRALKTSVQLNPNFWHSRADLGKILISRGEVDLAITHLQKAAELNPSATTPLYLLAQAYRRKGDEGRAGELLKRVSTMQAEEREALPQAALKNIVREGAGGNAVNQPKP